MRQPSLRPVVQHWLACHFSDLHMRGKCVQGSWFFAYDRRIQQQRNTSFGALQSAKARGIVSTLDDTF